MIDILLKFKDLILAILGTSAIAGTVVLGAAISDVAMPDQPKYDTIKWAKPITDQEWAEDVKKESLNLKRDDELQNMKADLDNKLITVQKPLYDEATLYPDAIKFELIKDGIKEPDLTDELNRKIADYKFEYEKVQQSLDRINKEIDLRKNHKVDRSHEIQ